MSNTDEQAARTAYLKRHPMRAVGRSFDEMQVFEIRRDSFQAGWDAATQHVYAERDAGEVCGDCGHNRNDHLGECKIPASELWLCPCEGYRPVSEHLTDADEPQPDHIPDVTEMVQHASKMEQAEADEQAALNAAKKFVNENGPQGTGCAFVSGWNAAMEYAGETEPINVVLFCPRCKTQHIDKPDYEVCKLCGEDFQMHDHDAVGAVSTCRREVFKFSDFREIFEPWTNPPHKSHRCSNCNIVWRPADVPTNGVEKAKTVGDNDTKDWVIDLRKDILQMSEADLRKDLIEENIDPDELIKNIRALINRLEKGKRI